MPAFIYAGLAGSLAHTALMLMKHQLALFPDFEPYDAIQLMLSHLLGAWIPAWAALALTYFNGSVVVGFLFSRSYPLLPGRSGLAKGLIFGFGAWTIMNVGLFPALGLGLFGVARGGISVPLFTLLMLTVYSAVMGMAHAFLQKNRTIALIGRHHE